MFQGHELDKEHLSPSMRREWIEMPMYGLIRITPSWSPSMRREWIEMALTLALVTP